MSNEIVPCYSSLFYFGADFAQEGRPQREGTWSCDMLVWQKALGFEQRNQLFTILGEWGWLVATNIFSEGTLFSSSPTHWNHPSPAFWHLSRGGRCLCQGPVLTGRNVFQESYWFWPSAVTAFNAPLSEEAWDRVVLAALCMEKWSDFNLKSSANQILSN